MWGVSQLDAPRLSGFLALVTLVMRFLISVLCMIFSVWLVWLSKDNLTQAQQLITIAAMSVSAITGYWLGFNSSHQPQTQITTQTEGGDVSVKANEP